MKNIHRTALAALLWLGICTFSRPLLLAQKASAIAYGTVTDRETGERIGFATVSLTGKNKGTVADEKGNYELKVPAGEEVMLEFSFVNYKTLPRLVLLEAGERERVDAALEYTVSEEVVVKDRRPSSNNDGVRTDAAAIRLIPTISQNLESLLSGIGLGVSGGMGGELSSQYSVRGGSYDENLVYVNDFEIYRPFLIRTGQQEGLTFPNLDLIRDLSFSSGGFDAKYGDKLSSVLNITYKRPDTLRASAGASLLGGSAHLEGSFPRRRDPTGNQRLRYLLGYRYKTTRYLLGSLEVKGEFAPSFSDFQGMITYDFSDEWQLSAIGNYSRSVYQYVPEELTSTLGLINYALQFKVAFEGQEIDDFNTGMGGVSLSFVPKGKNYYLKWLASAYNSRENERFDLIGYYLLGELETDLGSNQVGEVVSILGTGVEQHFARNYLTATVANLEHKGGWEMKNTAAPDRVRSWFLQWGAKYQREDIQDRLNEWERLDSAGYSLPHTGTDITMNEVVKSEVRLSSDRYSAYLQATRNYTDSLRDLSWTMGVRAQHWNLNGETVISPRTQLFYKPLRRGNDLSLKLAAGLYVQPPFYRELRNLSGEVNRQTRSQKSAHLVAGGTYDFEANGKPFRFIAEAYYKHFWDLVPYDIENVRLRYYGDNFARGYATGLDLRINGEFVADAESWVNLSFLRTREQFYGVSHKIRTADLPDSLQTVKDVPRPTDRFMNLSIFFQDYLPQNENLRMHLNLTVGTGLPFGLPDDNVVQRNIFRYNPYHRIDIGFSALLWNKSWLPKHPKHFLRKFENVWASAEVYNLMEVANTSSNTWVKTVFSQEVAIPNRLTSRRINLRLRVDL